MVQRVEKRNGSVVLEAIVALPVLLIAVMAIVELGLLSSNQSVVHSASVAGADAAVALGCTLPTTGSVPSEIIEAVEGALACQNARATCIRVEHTIGRSPPHVLEMGTGASPPLASPPASDYVCVSVCVENTELAPNLLRTFCLNLQETYSQQTVCRCVSCPSP